MAICRRRSRLTRNPHCPLQMKYLQSDLQLIASSSSLFGLGSRQGSPAEPRTMRYPSSPLLKPRAASVDWHSIFALRAHCSKSGSGADSFRSHFRGTRSMVTSGSSVRRNPTQTSSRHCHWAAYSNRPRRSWES